MLLHDPDVGDGHAAIDGFAHVVDGQQPVKRQMQKKPARGGP
jgi:hypothetical protein